MDTIFEKKDDIASTFHITYEEDENKQYGNDEKEKKT